MKIAIYGAKSLALGMYKAIEKLYPEQECIGFVVNSRQNNPSTLSELPVIEMDELKEMVSLSDRGNLHILICTPEDIHGEIVEYLQENGFTAFTCMDSVKEAELMERYFIEAGNFKTLHDIKVSNDLNRAEAKSCENKSVKLAKTPELHVYQAKFYRDKTLNHTYDIPKWVHPIQVGAVLTDVRVAEICDNEGENISSKNVNYCELTALYWMWKNKLLILDGDKDSDVYYGLFHYRRILDMSDEDIVRMGNNDVDVVVAFPTLHEPDMKEHHSRYISESDWEAMLQALQELQPEYAEAFADVLAQPYMYNYNMLVAKKDVLSDYCAWLFPILERTEEFSTPKGWERADRYIGYLGENLMTLYFMYNKDKLSIAHTGRLMLT